MHKNPVWYTLLASVTFCVIWYGATAFLSLRDYYALDTQTAGTVTQWMVKKESGSRYTPHVEYTYQVDGKTFVGKTRLGEFSMRNSWGADQQIISLNKEAATVWYASTTPTLSRFKKSFPYYDCFATVALLGILGYFFWLGSYVTRKIKT